MPPPKKNVRILMIFLFIVTFFTPHLALGLVTAKENASHLDMLERMWMFFLFLPIPLSSLVLGIICKLRGYKTVKNIVIGIIFSLLLFGFGSFSFLFRDMYSRDFTYVTQIEKKISFDLPNTGKIATMELTGWRDGEENTVFPTFTHQSDITFTSEEEISEFNHRIKNSEHWLSWVNTPLRGLLPSGHSSPQSLNQYDYFMIYNVDLGSYNTLPKASGAYEFIFLAYNMQGGTMVVIDYSLDVLI